MIQLYGKLFVSHYTQLGLIAGDVRRTKENRGGDQKSRPRHNYAQAAASASSNSNSNLNVDNTQTSKRPITSYYTPTTSSSSSTTSTSTERSYYNSNNNNNGNYNSNYNNNDDSKRKPQNNGIFKFIIILSLVCIFSIYSLLHSPVFPLTQKTAMISLRVPTARTSLPTGMAVANSMRSLHRVPGQMISVITIARQQRQHPQVNRVPRPHVDNAPARRQQAQAQQQQLHQQQPSRSN